MVDVFFSVWFIYYFFMIIFIFTINMVAQQQKKNTIRNNDNLTKSTIFRTYNYSDVVWWTELLRYIRAYRVEWSHNILQEPLPNRCGPCRANLHRVLAYDRHATVASSRLWFILSTLHVHNEIWRRTATASSPNSTGTSSS